MKKKAAEQLRIFLNMVKKTPQEPLMLVAILGQGVQVSTVFIWL